MIKENKKTFYLIVLYGCVCQPLINGYDDDDDDFAFYLCLTDIVLWPSQYRPDVTPGLLNC